MTTRCACNARTPNSRTTRERRTPNRRMMILLIELSDPGLAAVRVHHRG
jgi:hypothetical protein